MGQPPPIKTLGVIQVDIEVCGWTVKKKGVVVVQETMDPHFFWHECAAKIGLANGLETRTVVLERVAQHENPSSHIAKDSPSVHDAGRVVRPARG